MADCSYSRCIQQRRNIRRELQRWTKNMVHIVGLERIAEELMGRRKWKLYQDSMSRSYLQPLNNNIKTRLNEECYDEQAVDAKLELKGTKDASQAQPETNGIDDKLASTKENTKDEDVNDDRAREAEDRLRDWSPQTKCYFCVDGKLDSEHVAHGVLSPRHSDSDSTDSHSDSELPPSLTPTTSAPGPINNHHSANMTTMESVTSMAALAAVAALSGNPGAAPQLPFYPPNLPPNWYLAARSFQHAERLQESERVGGEQPLDLSCSKGGSNPNHSVENKIPSNIRLPTLDTKHIFKAKPRMSAVAGRRTYTEDELQAALRDIQSGKLGTRRAAVIYGIPRSTLRNKVYKLALERERESHLNTNPLKLDEEEAMDDDKELSGAEEEKEVEKVLQAPLLSYADIVNFSSMDNPDALKALLEKCREGRDAWVGLEHSSVGPYIQNILLASGVLSKTPPEGELNPLLPDVFKKILAEDQILKEQIKSQQHHNGESERVSRSSPSNSVITKLEKSKSESDMEAEESPSNVILKIPSFKPTTSKNGCDLFRNTTEPSIVSPSVTSDSSSPPILPGKGMSLKDVKEVIAQSISQKFQQTLEPARRPIMELDFKRGGYTPPLGGISVIKSQQDLNRPYQPPQKPQQNSNAGGAQGGKGTRPKRGKYRNYDRDSLVEAVRAVQRGEMSVHRAGSYYGVPHSTLEYKVKERHLMRPRKRDPKPNPIDEKIASIKQSEMRNTPDKMKPVMKPPQKFPPTSPNGMKLPIFEQGLPLAGYNTGPFPFWSHPGFHHIPLEYGRNFPPNPPEFFGATQMMQKLQEESSRTHPGTSQPGAANPSPALAQHARQMAESLLDGTGGNSSFLDGIIRSSLESGVPGSDERAVKEDKNVAPENMSNKALLDQLCKTPLTKPSLAETNTSGDESSYRKDESPVNFASEENSSFTGSPNRKENSDFHAIELSNDSVESRSKEEDRKSTPPARIYLKHELTKPENLKPEMLVRFRDVLANVDRNGISESLAGSASESDVAQD